MQTAKPETEIKEILITVKNIDKHQNFLKFTDFKPKALDILEVLKEKK